MINPGGPPKSSATTHGDRVRDVISLILVIGGIVLVVMAYVVNTRLATHPITDTVPKGHSAFNFWLRFYYIELVGYAMILVGIILGIASYIVHERRTRRTRGQSGGAA